MEKRWNINYSQEEFLEVQNYIDSMQDFPAYINNAKALAATLYHENNILMDCKGEADHLRARNAELEAEAKREIEARIYAEKLLMNEPCTVDSHKQLEAEVARLRKEIISLCNEAEEIKDVYLLVSELKKLVKLEASDG